MTPDAFRKAAASGTVPAVCVLAGDDETGKAAAISALIDTVEAELRAFNVERLYAMEASVTIGSVLDAARTLPWMSTRRVVIVMQAEKLLVTRGGDDDGGAAFDDLERYLAEPSSTTVLVLVVPALDKRLNVTKVLYKSATVVEFGGLAEGRDVESLIKSRAADAGVTFEPAAIRAFVARTGGDVTRIRADLDRVLTFASESKRVTADDVAELVAGPGVQDIWALNRALERNAAGDALRELALMLDEGAVPYMVLGQIRSFVDRSLPPQKLAAATEALMRTDLALKTSGGDPRVLLERLVVELTSPTSPTSLSGRGATYSGPRRSYG